MQLKDQILYHQIHIAKLLTAGAAGIIVFIRCGSIDCRWLY
jgi:hypothetical protein